MLWCCWLGVIKAIRPVKTEWWGAGIVVCLERGADLHVVQLMPLPLTVSCFSKIQIGLTFLVPADLGSPGQRAVKWVCVCVCVYVFDTVVQSLCTWALLWWSNACVYVCVCGCYSSVVIKGGSSAGRCEDQDSVSPCRCHFVIEKRLSDARNCLDATVQVMSQYR